MNAFVICVEGIIYLLLYNLHDFTLKSNFPLSQMEKCTFKSWFRISF